MATKSLPSLSRERFGGLGGTVAAVSDTIAIRGLQVDCIIGVHAHERDDAQPIGVDIELGLDLRRAGHTGRIGDTCDYSQVAVEVRDLLQFRRYQLLEGAAEEICGMLLGLHTEVRTAELRLRKPKALTGLAEAAMVGVRRTREDYPRRFETSRFGEVEILLETSEAGLYLLHIDPGQAIPAHHHQRMRELEWIVRGNLWWEDAQLPLRAARAWPHGEIHGYENRGEERATVFCCDTPPFIPEDEIEVAR